MTKDPSKLRQKIRRLQESLDRPLQALLAVRGKLRPGSLVTLRRKCGKANCHCAQGPGHPAQYLSVREEGRTRLYYISARIGPAPTQEAERYRHFRRQRALLAGRVRLLLSRIDELEEALRTREPMPRVQDQPKGSHGRTD